MPALRFKEIVQEFSVFASAGSGGGNDAPSCDGGGGVAVAVIATGIDVLKRKRKA